VRLNKATLGQSYVGKIRLFLMSLLVGAILAQTGTALVSSAQAATMEMMQAEVAPMLANGRLRQEYPGCDAPCHLSSSVAAAVASRPLIGCWFRAAILVDGLYRFPPRLLRTRPQRSGNDLQRPPRSLEKRRCLRTLISAIAARRLQRAMSRARPIHF